MVKAALRNNRCLFYKKNMTFWNTMLCIHTHWANNHVPQYQTCHKKFITYADCIQREFRVHFSPAVQFPSFQRTASKCQTPDSKQASHLLKIFLHTWWSSHLCNINIFITKYYSSVTTNNADCPHNLNLLVSATHNNCTLCSTKIKRLKIF
jgi:hypothetical protein